MQSDRSQSSARASRSSPNQCGLVLVRSYRSQRPTTRRAGQEANRLLHELTRVGPNCSKPGTGAHVLCIGRVAHRAAIFSRGLCRAILKGATEQTKADRLNQPGWYGVQAAAEKGAPSGAGVLPQQGSVDETILGDSETAHVPPTHHRPLG